MIPVGKHKPGNRGTETAFIQGRDRVGIEVIGFNVSFKGKACSIYWWVMQGMRGRAKSKVDSSNYSSCRTGRRSRKCT